MSYNRYVPRPDIEDSTLHKVKATYWEAKHKIMTKIGKNDDEHVQASDAELDAKIEVLKSVQRTTDQLLRLINEYEFSMYGLAKSEYACSRFLKTQSEVDKTRAGKIMAAVGRVENFSSQQRLGFRQPLERFYQECETFRMRAVADTASNLDHMETARNDYRAALMWMKDVSEELDPDTTRQLEKFRKVQAQVRKKKELFDRLKLDVMQKVDMLAASRANMFSRALEYYQKWLMEFNAKNAKTLQVVAKGFSGMYHYYEFNVIKDLAEPNKLMAESTGSAVDDEQMQAVISELEATITELSNLRDNSSIIPRLVQRDENADEEQRDYRYYKQVTEMKARKQQEGDDDDRNIELIGDLGENGFDDNLILAESEADKGKEGKAAQQKGAAAQQSQIDLMASDFFDIEKADGAMAELTKRQRERTMGSGLDADEQLLLSLAGPAPQSGDASNQGGMGAHEELKLLDELLSVMNQAVDGKDTASGGGLDALGDLSLDRSWHTESSAGGRNDLDFMRPAEASSLAAMMPSQLLELQSGHSSQLFSLPFGPFGTSSSDQQQKQASAKQQQPFLLQEQQRSGLLLGPSSVGKLVSNNQMDSAKLSLGDLASGQKPKAGSKESTKFDLFADLDPFANPDAIGKKIQPSDADQL